MPPRIVHPKDGGWSSIIMGFQDSSWVLFIQCFWSLMSAEVFKAEWQKEAPTMHLKGDTLMIYHGGGPGVGDGSRGCDVGHQEQFFHLL